MGGGGFLIGKPVGKQVINKHFLQYFLFQYADVIQCQTAKDLKRTVDDNLIFLIVMLACTLNTIFQSTVPLFHGEGLLFSIKNQFALVLLFN